MELKFEPPVSPSSFESQARGIERAGWVVSPTVICSTHAF